MTQPSASFFANFVGDAKTAALQTGILTSVILAQWADETGYGATLSDSGSRWNFAGISESSGTLKIYATEAVGVAAYVTTINSHLYDKVRAAVGPQAQCIALGQSPWAGGHYDANDFNAGRPITQPGIDLVNIINSFNLTKYDPPGGVIAGLTSLGDLALNGTPLFQSVPAITPNQLAPINPPAVGFESNFNTGTFQINGATMDLDVSNAIVNSELILSITAASTVVLTLDDPNSTIINNAVFLAGSVISFGSTGQSFVLVEVDKQGTVLTATFEAYVVNALRHAIGATTVAAGTMTRTDFAKMLIQQIVGATTSTAPESFLYTLNDRYTHNAQEQLSRGTVDVPLEDSWTALQRIATEIQWVCFETYGTVYFGPYSWLAQPTQVVLAPVQFYNGVDTIDGTYNVNQPLGDLTINAVAGAWTPAPGNAITINGLGPFDGTWIVSEMNRASMTQPDIVITCVAPQPGLPEPSTGGQTGAVGPAFNLGGAVQTTDGQTAAAQAVAAAITQLGVPYLYGGENPKSPGHSGGFDCSGLMQWAYASVGIPIPRTTAGCWPNGIGGGPLPPGIGNLKPGDLLFFSPSVGTPPVGNNGHVVMVVSVGKGATTVKCIEAPHTGAFVQYTTVTPTVGANYGSDVYLGALRPAP